MIFLTRDILWILNQMQILWKWPYYTQGITFPQILPILQLICTLYQLFIMPSKQLQLAAQIQFKCSLPDAVTGRGSPLQRTPLWISPHQQQVNKPLYPKPCKRLLAKILLIIFYPKTRHLSSPNTNHSSILHRSHLRQNLPYVKEKINWKISIPKVINNYQLFPAVSSP